MKKKHYIIPIFVPHEGCPHNCVFCNQNSITGKIRIASENSIVIDENFVRKTVRQYLTTIDRENSILEISFFGGTFTAINMDKQKELLKVAKEYKDKGIIDYIRLSTRPDYIDIKILDNLKSFSVDVIELGVQSLDEDVLIGSGRGHSKKQVYEASNLIKSYGFTLGHQIMLGLPNDNFKKDIETTKEIIEMKPHICRIYPALVIKDTPMEKMFLDGIYKPYTLTQAVEVSKVIYSMLTINGINVIRIGLQPTDEINEGGELVSGPFHPAFRELVESSLMNEMILDKINEITLDNINIKKSNNEKEKFKDVKDIKQKEEIEILVNGKDISKIYANGKTFFNDMKKQLNNKIVKIKQDSSIQRGELVINIDKKTYKMSIFEFMLKHYKEGN